MSNSGFLRLNPEFQRCLWLELTPTRLVLMPSVLALVFGAGKLTGADDLAQWVVYGLYFLLVLWGSRLAAESFVEEVNQGTWDLQRLSAVDPWSMALGKLFGGSAFVWYGGLLCLGALPFLPGAVDSHEIAGAVVGGITAQAAALLVVMVVHRFDGAQRRGAVTMAQVLGIVASAPSLGFSSLFESWGDQAWWYGSVYSLQSFTLFHEIIWAGWLIIGVVWMTRIQLGHAVSPAPWLIFTAWQTADVVGILFSEKTTPPATVILGVAAMTAAGWTYVAVLASPFGIGDLKRWMASKDWNRRWQWAPAWSLSALIAVVLGLATLPFSGGDQILGAALLALFLRDMALIGAVRLASRRRTALLLCVLAFILYVLAPEVLDALGGADLRAWAEPGRAAPALSLIGPWGMAAASFIILHLSWKRRSVR